MVCGGSFRGLLERGQVVERGARHRRRGEVELVQGLDHRERGAPHPGAGVRLVPAGDLGLDQCAQELLGVPAVGLCGDQQLRGQLADGGELEPAEPGDQIGCQRGATQLSVVTAL
jgi:hypothetical protein